MFWAKAKEMDELGIEPKTFRNSYMDCETNVIPLNHTPFHEPY